jgi:hypothetical protein
VRRLALLLLLAATPAAAQERAPSPALTLDEYRGALESVAAGLEKGDWEGARALAGALRGARVRADGGVFEADSSLLAAVDAAKDASAAARARLRVLRVVASLGDAGFAGPEPDAARLARLAREEAARRPREGGTIDASLAVRPLTVPERLRRWLDRAASALVEWLGKLLDWLARAGPRPERERSGATAGVVTALVAAIALVLAVAAVRSMRRRDAAETRGEAGEASPERDFDPLSREAAEWERYAGELASAGRRREAIRAWYHAVLVALFRAGRLHHQKGRTNWEYVGQVRPDVRWRGTFVSLTEAFDREWYGRDASAPEALRECAARARELLRSVHGEAAA